MKKVVVFLTTCLLLLCTIISAAAQGSTRAAKYGDLDYSSGSHGTVTMHMGDLLGFLGGFEVTEAEKNYIRVNYDGECKLYYSRPEVYELEHTYDGKNRRLTIVVMDDLHEGKYADLLWVPVTATVGESTASFEPAPDRGSNYYRAVLENVQWSASLAIDIAYGADIVVTSATLNDFINYAYESAGKLNADKIAYDIAYELYQKSEAEWEQYEKDSAEYELYLDKVALYQDYLLYVAYQEKLDAYNIIHEAYLANQQAWNTYFEDEIKYQNYLDYKNNDYPALLAAYAEKKATVDHQLYLLSLLEKVDPKTEMSFAEMMMDDRIAKKIQKHETTVSMATSKSTVDSVVKSTYALQDFFKAYTKLETEQEKYEYYIAEYKTFAKHLKNLYDGIQEIYESDIVYDEMCAQYPDYVTDMVRMMGSLYIQNCVFNDGLNMNLNQIVDIRGKQKASVLVDPSVRPESDTNKAAPLEAWPAEPADPESFEVKEKPVMPTETLEDGIAPERPNYGVIKNEAELDPNMQDPGHMDQPTEPDPKPANPVKLNWSASQQALYDVYVEGQLAYREPFTEDQTLTIRETTAATIYMDPSDIRYTVYFYNTDEYSTYLGRADDIREGQAAVVPPSAMNPAKPADAQYTYEFIGWVDAQGNPVDLSCITKDMTVYAEYKSILRSYTVTWVVEGESTEQTVPYGEIPVFEGTPQKAANAQYYYTFDNWDKEILPVNGDVTYTARFQSHLQKYSVTFHMGNGETIVKEYFYGQSLADVVSTMGTPYKEPTAQYSYTFKGWRDAKNTFYSDKSQLPTLTENMTFTAEFNAALNSYTITWVVNGTEVKGVWEYGEMPAYGADPFKETDDRCYYHFDGWDKTVVAVTGDATYTAQFREELRYYNVTFIVDGVSNRISVEYGQMPTFEGATDKQSDAQYHYTFTGWDREVAAVTGDATYTAQYSTELRKYKITFIVEGVETTAEFEYGTLPRYTESTPEKPENLTFMYVFSGWDKEIVPVDGSEAVYTAVFEEVPLAPMSNGKNATLVDLGNGNYLLEIEATGVNLALVFDKLGRDQANSLTVNFGDVVLVFPKEQIDAFYLMGDGISDVTVEKVMHQGMNAYAISLVDAQQAPIDYLVSELAVKIRYSGAYTANLYYLESDNSLSKIEVELADGYLVFSTMRFSTFVIKDKYMITKAPSENGTITAPDEAYCGDQITFTIDAVEGYHVDSVKAICNGEVIAITMSNGVYSFTMPNGNVEISATYKVVESGSMTEVIVGVLTAVLIVAIGLVIVVIVSRKKNAKA